MSSIVSVDVPQGTHVDLLVDLADISEIREPWSRLHEETPGAGFFLTFDWLECLWRHLPDRLSPRVFVVRRDDEIIGIAPLSLLNETTRLGTVPILGFPLQDWGTTFNCVGVEADTIWQAVFRSLGSQRRDWSIVDLRWLVSSSVDTMIAAAETVALSCSVHQWQRCYLIDFRPGWEAYWSGLKGKFRNNVGRHERKLHAMGDFVWERYRPEGPNIVPRWDLYQDVLQVSKASWQHAVEDGTTISDASVADFLREAHELAETAGMLDMGVLRLDGRPIAYTYNYFHQGRIDALRFGFDPEFRHLGPGSVLIKLFLQDSFRRGDVLVNLGARDYGYKHRWSNEQLVTSRLTHYAAADVRAQMLRIKRHLHPDPLV